MKTIVVVPVKGGTQQKSRLADALSVTERERLVADMAHHVLAQARLAAGDGNVVILSPAPIGAAYGWREDRLRGFNEELTALRADERDAVFVVVNADLPFVQAEDIAELIAAAREGAIAIAPNRDGSGTNAVALPPNAEFTFAFGVESFERHRQSAGARAMIVRRNGLAFDVDTPADLADARRAGLA